jgi:hypothetical protein
MLSATCPSLVVHTHNRESVSEVGVSQTKRFEGRDLKPYAEPVAPADLEEGAVGTSTFKALDSTLRAPWNTP